LFVLFEEAELQNIAVDIPFRKQGLGSELVSFLHEFAKEKGAEKSFLEVRVSNRAAIGLYEKHGYAIYGERSRYYQDGESAYVMQKQL
jgi:ribosomal-protein-alanine N-acetyltransferase